MRYSLPSEAVAAFAATLSGENRRVRVMTPPDESAAAVGARPEATAVKAAPIMKLDINLGNDIHDYPAKL